jgi:hypothetical protein
LIYREKKSFTQNVCKASLKVRLFHDYETLHLLTPP